MARSFDELVDEAAAAPVEGWDFDVGAVVFFLRKVVWTVPYFSVDRYRARLQDLHDQIEQDGGFRSTMSRTLFEARKPPAT